MHAENFSDPFLADSNKVCALLMYDQEIGRAIKPRHFVQPSNLELLHAGILVGSVII